VVKQKENHLGRITSRKGGIPSTRTQEGEALTLVSKTRSPDTSRASGETDSALDRSGPPDGESAWPKGLAPHFS